MCRHVELKWEHLHQVVHKHVALRSNVTLYEDVHTKSKINFNVSYERCMTHQAPTC